MSRKIQLAFGSAMSIPVVVGAAYRKRIVSGLIKGITAATSVLTSATLIPLVPRVM